jgi:peptidoglycan/LPS O-acetylase OafA/YrhL
MAPPGARDRVHFLDWLRVVALLAVFLFHTMRPFDEADWHVQDIERSAIITGVLAFMGSWGLAFFFLVAGAGTGLALRWRTPGAYVRERLMRLLLPLLVAYVLPTPVQYLIERRHQLERGNLGALAREVWVGPPLLLGYPYHLWFVIFLLEFSLLGLPLFLWLRGRMGRRFVGWLAARASRHGTAILLLIVPVAVLHVAAQGSPGADHGWGEFLYYFDFFLLGYVVMADERLTAAVRRNLGAGMGLAATGLLLVVTGGPAFFDAWSDDPSYSWRYAWFFFLLTVQAWGWIVAVLALGMRIPMFQRPLPPTAAAAAMPFFLLHQPVILAVAFVVVRWKATIPVKLLLIVTASLVITWGLAWILARMPGLATLFGVKRARPGVGPPAATGARTSVGRVARMSKVE